jgi:hypothetical protein
MNTLCTLAALGGPLLLLRLLQFLLLRLQLLLLLLLLLLLVLFLLVVLHKLAIPLFVFMVAVFI